jgi:hypothetical protein
MRNAKKNGKKGIRLPEERAIRQKKALLSSRIESKEFVLVQLFSFPKGLQFILSADQNPAFLNFDREKAIRLLEAQKRKGKYAHLDLPDTSRVTKGAQEEEEESFSSPLQRGLRATTTTRKRR